MSVDLRERVVAAVAAGASCHRAAARFGVSVASANRRSQRSQQEGHVAPKPMGGDHTSKRIEAHAALILATSKQEPRLFLRELRDRLAEQGVQTSMSGPSRFFLRHAITLKKGATFAAEQEREDVRAAREAWFEAQPELDPDRLVFLDETAAATNMARRYGWAPRGERYRLAAPFGHYKTRTITAALRTSGLCATALLDGPTNGTCFCRYVTETSVPVLQPDNIVVMDNLPAHKVAGVQDAIKAAGARLLYLPPYSPVFNPIEQVFAKLKALLRSAAARTIPDLWAAIGQVFTRFTPQECRNDLAAAGYENDLAVAT
ncbi:IS630 family transposase [Methylorubrum extorquens]|uniref:IS630 family transposase n=1 Tax=Methylorubrum extorquens TaxID=408 RepID=UPI0018721D9A|nr:IS630 family transposase [Methylorubrum extorquens]